MVVGHEFDFGGEVGWVGGAPLPLNLGGDGVDEAVVAPVAALADGSKFFEFSAEHGGGDEGDGGAIAFDGFHEVGECAFGFGGLGQVYAFGEGFFEGGGGALGFGDGPDESGSVGFAGVGFGQVGFAAVEVADHAEARFELEAGEFLEGGSGVDGADRPGVGEAGGGDRFGG